MNIDFDIYIHSHVEIIPLKAKGIVLGIYIATKGTQYLVRYFNDMKAEEVYFFHWELKKVE